MEHKLAVLIITKNNQDTIEKTLLSVKELTSEIYVIDSRSVDSTTKIAKKYGAKIFIKDYKNIGKQRAYGLTKINNEWVLILDSDEILSKQLRQEIIRKILAKNPTKVDGFLIPYKNHFLGRAVNFGGENYRMLRLFRKSKLRINPSLIHNDFILTNGNISALNGKILHFSYRSLSQMFFKFTNYAIQTKVVKASKNEKSSLKKIFLYPIHMFYARFIKDKGYKDGLFRIPLDLGFAYMEFLTYFLLFFKPKRK